jgi:hypothetical protein
MTLCPIGSTSGRCRSKIGALTSVAPATKPGRSLLLFRLSRHVPSQPNT